MTVYTEIIRHWTGRLDNPHRPNMRNGNAYKYKKIFLDISSNACEVTAGYVCPLRK
jgi:hypothetical protein